MLQVARMPYVHFKTEVETTQDAQGHNVYKNVIYAHVTSAGSKDVVVKIADEWIAQLREKSQTRGAFDSAANEYEQWYDRFSKLLQNYKNGQEMEHEGTPLRASMAFSPAEVAQCENVKIFTIETLAVCTEEAMSRMGMGGRALKQKACKLLENQDGVKLAQENAALHVKVSELTAKVEQLTSLIGTDNLPKKRGPKPKQE